MLTAELNGKTSTLTSEDVLTSHVFSLFRYLSNYSALTSFLRCAKNMDGEQFYTSNVTTATIEFWPKFRVLQNSSFREADVLLLLKDDNGGTTAVLVEAKYLSGLSTRESTPLNTQDGSHKATQTVLNSSHQLADEYFGLKQGQWIIGEALQKALEESRTRLLIYVTANHKMPNNDVLDAISALRIHGVNNSHMNPKREIYWVGWWHLHHVIGMELENNEVAYSQGERNL